jgi:hypothetical protein
MTEVAVLGIDLGKTSCSVVGMSVGGRVARDGLQALLGKLPPCVVAMEACCGAHHCRPCRGGAWAPGPADATGVCPAVCEGAEGQRP